MENTKIDIGENLNFLIGDIIGIERYKINLDERSVRCDSLKDIEKVTKFINFLIDVRNINSTERNANSIINCLKGVYCQESNNKFDEECMKLETFMGISIKELIKLIDKIKEFHPGWLLQEQGWLE